MTKKKRRKEKGNRGKKKKEERKRKEGKREGKEEKKKRNCVSLSNCNSSRHAIPNEHKASSCKCLDRSKSRSKQISFNLQPPSEPQLLPPAKKE